MVHQPRWSPALDDASAVPIYEQLVEQLSLAVASGLVQPGDPLPSVRGLAAELRVNPNTAARALREIDRLGLARTQRGVGSVVAEEAPAVAARIARRILAREIERAVAAAGRLGIGRRELLEAVESRWKEVFDAG